MNMNHVACLVGLCASCLVVDSVRGDNSAVWTQGAVMLGDGAVTVQYDDAGKISSLIAEPDGGTFALTGTEALDFADDATLAVSNGTLRVETPVVSSGALNLRTGYPNAEYIATDDYLPKTEAAAVVVASGIQLDFLQPHIAFYKRVMKQYNYGSGPNSIAQPYFIERSEGTLSCQMQLNEGGWTKCVFLELRQRGEDIVAWTPKAGYMDQKDRPLGSDFRTFTPPRHGREQCRLADCGLRNRLPTPDRECGCDYL